MKPLCRAYHWVERHFFQNLSRKLAGNLLFLVLLQGLAVLALHRGRSALAELLRKAGASPEVLARADALMAEHVQIGAAIGAVALVAAVFAFCFLRFLIVRPIRSSIAHLRALGQGGGDLSADLPVMTCDEIGELARAYNGFVGQLRGMIADLRRMGVGIAVESAQVAKRVEDSAGRAGEQQTLAEVIVRSSQEATEAIDSSSAGLQRVADSTGRNLEAAREAVGELRQVADQMEGVTGRMAAFRDTVEELDRTSRGTGAIVSLIEDISDQTNLLALNAAIEAARAGEAGRGFAVVAEEVRKLADKVKSATGEIASNIRSMSSQTRSVLDETLAIGARTAQARSVVQQSSQTLQVMVGDFEGSNEQLLQIATAVEELSTTNLRVHEKISHVRGLSREVSERMAQSGASAAELGQITERLQVLVSQFRVGQGSFEAIVFKARLHRELMAARIAELHARGVDVFDDRYRPVPGTTPPKYETSYTEAFRQELQPLYDRALADVDGAVFALCVDRNGYAPTHNGKYSKPVTGDPKVDLAQSRDRRKFDDKTGLRAARSEAPLLLQTYVRDTGEIMNDLSIPLWVAGRHWGALRLGLQPAALLGE